MSKTTLTIAVASLAGLTSCFPPKPPPRAPGLYGRSGPTAYETRDDYRTERPNDYRGDADYDTPPGDFDQRPPARPTTPGSYPVARRTANPDQVISPFSPFNVIDVEGFKSGQLARDPSNQQIFRIP
jgi:hypothetical protein